MTTKQKGNTVALSAKEWVLGDRDLMKEALEEMLEVEMTEFLGAAPNKRSPTRNGYRAGYYERGLVTRIGKLELRVPRDRHGEFSTALFERYARSEKALVGALPRCTYRVFRPARSRRSPKSCADTASRPRPSRRSTRAWTRHSRALPTGRWKRRIRT